MLRLHGVCALASTNNSNIFALLNVRNNEQVLLRGIPDRDQALLTSRVVRVIERCGKRVVKYGNGFVE